MNTFEPAGQDFFQQFPKVELHRHLEGSLRISTMKEIARVHGVTLPVTNQLRPLVQIQAHEAMTHTNFLSKFQILRLFYRTPEIIQQITREAVRDAAEDHVEYLELRFTPVALGREQRFDVSNVLDWVCTAASEARLETGVMTRLIVSVNRHEPVEIAEKVVDAAVAHQKHGVCGLDLAGNEAEFPAEPFIALFRQARAAGLSITVHAGEWSGPENVKGAILDLGADRIGHGVRVMEDENVVALARERGIPFEVCPTSNYQSGVVANLAKHPLARMLAAGLIVTVNTDDPSISQITLGSEYKTVCDVLGLPVTALRDCVLAGARVAFLPAADRQALLSRLRARFQQTGIS